MNVPRLSRLASVRERHREHDATFRDLIRDVDYLGERVATASRDLRDDYDADLPVAVSAALSKTRDALGNAAWLLRGARRRLP